MWERTVYELVALRVLQSWRGSKWEAVDVTPRGCFGSGRNELLFLGSFPLRLGDGGLSSSEEGRSSVLSAHPPSPQEKLRHFSPALPSFLPCSPNTRVSFPETSAPGERSFSLSQPCSSRFPRRYPNVPRSDHGGRDFREDFGKEHRLPVKGMEELGNGPLSLWYSMYWGAGGGQ